LPNARVLYQRSTYALQNQLQVGVAGSALQNCSFNARQLFLVIDNSQTAYELSSMNASATHQLPKSTMGANLSRHCCTDVAARSVVAATVTGFVPPLKLKLNVVVVDPGHAMHPMVPAGLLMSP
jgi:hypothetical protein